MKVAGTSNKNNVREKTVLDFALIESVAVSKL